MAIGAFAALLLLLTAAPALAAPTTIDFESGAAPNEPVKAQYCCPGGVDKGPTFMNASTEAGFSAGSQPGVSGMSCGPPFLDASDQASSGTRTISLIGCATGEFTHSAGFFKLNWPTDSVEFQVGLPTETPSSCPNFICAEIWTTAFRADRSIITQQQTLLGPNTKFKTVPLLSGAGDIAYVAIERGTKETPTDSATGVMLAPLSPGSGYLVVDDLTYDPPSSPPESSFLLGASPTTARVAPGAKSPQIKIPVTWTANPDPSATPVSLELSAPPGVTGTFVPNPTNTGQSILVLEVEKLAEPGQYTVTVDGYVDKGEPSEKHSSVQIPFEITEPFSVNPLGDHLVSRCTPDDIGVRIATDPQLSDPIQVDVYLNPSSTAKFVATSAGSVIEPHHVSATINQSGGEAKMSVTVGMDLGAAAGKAGIVAVAEPSGYGPRSANGTVTVESGHINSVAPASGSTPQRGIPGTLMTVNGAGFCPGDKVAIGPPEDTANPESVATPGKSLTFRIPRAAVGGTLRILPLKGASFSGPVIPVTSFRNTSAFSWKNEDYGMRLTGQMMDELYGEDETNINILGWLIRKPEAGLLGEITNKHIPGGICFGMAFAAAQMFDSPSWVNEFPRTGNTVWGLDAPNTPSYGLLRFVTERFSLQFTDELIPVSLGQFLGQAIGAHDPSIDITEIRSLIGPGKPPLMLGLMHWSGGIEAHTVLAYDWEPGPDDTTIVYVYNPNKPYLATESGDWGDHQMRELTKSRIVIRNTDSYWKFDELGWEGPDQHLILFRHDEMPILNGKRPHMPNVFVAAGMFAFGSAGDSVTQVSDDSGHQLLDKGGPADPKRMPPGVAPMPSYTGAPAPLQMLAVEPRKAGDLTATMRRGKGGGAMDLTLPGLQASLQGGDRPGQVDRVAVDESARAIGYSPGATGPFGGTLISAPGGAAKSSAADRTTSERMVDFETTSSKGGEDVVSFAHGSAFEIDHDGAPASLSLTLSGFGADGLPVAVRLPKAHLARGESLTVTPSSWRRLGSAPIRVSSRLHGRTTTRVVRGKRVGRGFVAIRGAKLSPGGTRVNLTLRLKHPPKGASISPVVEVIGGGKVVAKSRPARFTGSAMAKPSLALTKRVHRGGNTFRVRVLEATADGLTQDSAVVRRSLTARR
jgi:hypothetical protein